MGLGFIGPNYIGFIVLLGRGYLEGRGDLVSSLILGTSRLIMWIARFITCLQSPHDPPSRV